MKGLSGRQRDRAREGDSSQSQRRRQFGNPCSNSRLSGVLYFAPDRPSASLKRAAKGPCRLATVQGMSYAPATGAVLLIKPLHRAEMGEAMVPIDNPQ